LASVRIEVLEKRHSRKNFSCGNSEIDAYIKTLARQHQERNFTKTYVAVEEGKADVLGYISVAMGSVLLQDADESVFSRLPKHPMPVLHVARLGTDTRFAGKGIASMLLAHAADLAIAASATVGVHALELHAIDQLAYDYYIRRGFLPLKGNTMRLYAPIDTLLAARAPS